MATNLMNYIPALQANNSTDRVNFLVGAMDGSAKFIGQLQAIQEVNQVRSNLAEAEPYRRAAIRLDATLVQGGVFKDTPRATMTALQRTNWVAEQISGRVEAFGHFINKPADGGGAQVDANAGGGDVPAAPAGNAAEFELELPNGIKVTGTIPKDGFGAFGEKVNARLDAAFGGQNSEMLLLMRSDLDAMEARLTDLMRKVVAINKVEIASDTKEFTVEHRGTTLSGGAVGNAAAPVVTDIVGLLRKD